MTQTYKAWRITYQSSEQAARAAFERMMELEQGNCLHQIGEPALDRREAFEAWARDYGTWEVKREDDPQLGTTGYTDLTLTVAWHALKAAHLAQLVQVPNGWKLVPDSSNMTDEQAEAICNLVSCCGGGAHEVYEAALAAAPNPPEVQASVSNATLAAPVQMPEPAGVMAPWPVDPSRDYIEWANQSPAQGTKLYTEQQVRQLLADHGIQEQST